MNRFDVQNLENSFGNLGQTIMQNRMMAEQKAERGQARTDRLSENAQSRTDRLQEEAKLDQYRQDMLKERMGATQNAKDAGVAKLAEALKKQASDSLHDTFDTIAKHVADGTVKPETANSMLKAAVAKLPDSLKDDPIALMVSDPDFMLVSKPSKDVQPAEKTFGDTTVIYNPNTGVFHVNGPTKTTGATVELPIGPKDADTGAQQGRIKGPITDPTVRAMLGTNAPPMPTVQPPVLPGQTPPAPAPTARVRKYNPTTGLIE